MSKLNYTLTRNRAIGHTIDDTIEEAKYRKSIEFYSLLELSDQVDIMERMVKAQANVVSNCIKAKDTISLPFIGKVLIKEGKRIELEIMQPVIEELGFSKITDMPKDDYKALVELHSHKISAQFIAKKRTKSDSRIRLKGRVRTFNLNSFKKT